MIVIVTEYIKVYMSVWGEEGIKAELLLYAKCYLRGGGQITPKEYTYLVESNEKHGYVNQFLANNLFQTNLQHEVLK